jgi:O-antigen/teichoic acid export membrane protein
MTTLADQCVASGSNFAVGIVVARISGPAGLGGFALAYTGWILVTLIHRSLITDPMMIAGDLRGDGKDEFIRRGFAADVTLGVMAACIIAAVGTALLVVGQHTFGVGLLSVAPWILVLDLQDYWRQIGFLQGTPRKSLMNDLLFNAVQALAFGAVFLAGLHSVFAVVSAWGLGAAVAALYGLRQYSVRPSVRGGRAFLRSHWQLSRWLAGERTASWGGSQLYLILTGVLLGPAALGGLKAAQGLMIGPTNVFIGAAGSFGLPEASRQLAERGREGLVRVSRFVTGAGVVGSAACGIAVLLAAPTLLKLLYGAAFVTYAPAARIFAVSVMVAAFSTGPVLTLMTTRRVRPLLILNLAKVPLSLATVCVLAALYGVTGAATTDLLMSVVTVVILLVLQSSARRSIEKAQTLPAMGFLEALRRRVVGNFNYLTGIWPASRAGSRRGNGVDLEVYPWGSRGAGAAPDVADHAQDYSTVHLIEADCSVPDDVTRH